MILTDEEVFALTKLFGADDQFSTYVRKILGQGEVISRKKTGIGYFSTIKFLSPFSHEPNQLQWDWNFNHKKLNHCGSFIAFFEWPNIVELEAVANMDKWPDIFIESDCSDVWFSE